MNKIVLIVLSVFVVLILILVSLLFIIETPSPQQNNPDSLAFVEVISGNVYYKPDVNSSWKLLSANQGVGKQSYVKTDSKSEAKISFFGGTYAILSENSEVKIEDFYEKNGTQTIKLEQESGTIWHRILKLFGKSDYSVTVGDVVASVRGTGFFTKLDSNFAEVIVKDGNVQVDVPGDRIYYVSKGYNIKINRATIPKKGVPQNLPPVIVDDKSVISGKGTPTTGVNVEKTNYGEELYKDIQGTDEKYISEQKEKLKEKYGIQIGIAKATAPEITDDVMDEYLGIAVTEGEDAAKQQVETDYNIDLDNYLNK